MMRGAVLLLTMLAGAACAGGDGATPDRGAAAAAADAARPAVADAATRDVVYLDVRTAEEYGSGHIEGALHIPYDELPGRLPELEEHRDAQIVVYCRTGRRSGIAESVLRSNGFQHIEDAGPIGRLVSRGLKTATSP